MHIIGLDIGTTSVCGICCDADTGKVVETITVPNNAVIAGENAWEKMQDATILVKKVKEITEQLMSRTPDVYSIGITGQMHGIVYLNDRGEILSPLYTWQDGRGDLGYKDGETYASWLSRETGYSLATGYGAVTHFYHVVNGSIPKGTSTFCTIHDLVALALTNETRPVLHPSDAASFGLYDLQTNQFDVEAIRKVGLDVQLFPNVQEGYPIIGKTKEGIPVSVAIGDNQASVLGTINDMGNSLLVNVGTGSQISCIVKGVPKNCHMDCRPLTDGYYLLAGSSLCGGRSYAILEKFLRDVATRITGQKIESAYEVMGKVMEDYVQPEQALCVRTTFSGTRQDPKERGSICNIDTENLTMSNLCNGFMNGMVTELYEMYEQMLPYMQCKPTKIVGSGNGIRLNPYLVACFARKFGMPLCIPKHKEEAAFGAAIFGLTAAKELSSIKHAQALIQYNEK